MYETDIESRTISRRRVVVTALHTSTAGWLAGIFAGSAHATPEEAAKLLGTLAKGQPKAGKVTITAPAIAENGNVVPISVAVESPMTDADYVKALHIVADGNPNPGVATFNLWPASGRAQVDFRMRLAQTQKVIAVAEMKDGSLWTAASEVKVTIGGCGG